MSGSQYLVVGAGLAGAATAWRLTQRGHEVTVVERSQPAAHDGSSHGSARILRYAYPEPDYIGWVARARDGWHELESQSGTPLLTPTPALDHGTSRNPRALATGLAAAGVDFELLDAATATARWPQLVFTGDVLHQPDGAVVDAETSVHAMIAQARSGGARILTDWSLTHLERSTTGFTAHSADGRHLQAGQVVICVGGWLPSLLDRLGLPASFRSAFPALRVTEENAFHFAFHHEYPHDTWPTLIHESPELKVYALPGGRDAGFGGLKIAEFGAGRAIGSASQQSGAIDPANRRRVVDFVRRTVPGLVPESYAESTCLFTATPTDDFVIDGVAGVTVVSACSGHGAKFAPLLGEIAADVATGTGEAPDRFRVRE